MATISVHVAYMEQVRVAPDGTVYSSSNNKKTIKESLNFSTDWRIIHDPANSNTANSPTLKAYLTAEATSGYAPVSVFSNYIVTVRTS
jgi:hypothetical protein